MYIVLENIALRYTTMVNTKFISWKGHHFFFLLEFFLIVKHENFSFNLYFIFHIYIYICTYLTQFHFKFSVALLLMVGCKVGQSSSIRLSYWILAKMVTLAKFWHQVVKSFLCWFLIVFNCDGQLK